MNHNNLSRTPDEVEIIPRNVKEEFSEILGTDFVKDNPYKTAYYNALSLAFPEGERFFIQAVRHFRNQIEDPKLLKEVSAFCGQENLHTREHVRFNKIMLESRDYDADTLMGLGINSKAKLDKYPPLERLAITVGAEHYTALLGQAVLEDPNWLDGMDPSLKRLWYWHAMEEMEHKGVCYDVYLAVGGTYWGRIKGLWIATKWLVEDLFSAIDIMLKKDGNNNWKTRMQGLKFLLGRKGVLWPLLGDFIDYFKPSYHPWNHDTRNLLTTWKERLGFA